MNDYRYLIFTGANERAIVAVCRFMQARGVKFSLIARPGEDKIKLTRYHQKIEAVRQRDNLELNDMISCITQIQACYPDDTLVFVPTAESINRMVLQHRNKFSFAGLKINLCDKDVYLKISDKETFLLLIKQYGMSSPPEYATHSVDSIPFVAKPYHEFSKKNGSKNYPHLILSEDDYASFLCRDDIDEYFYQKYVDGQSYYYLIRMDENTSPIIRYQKNLLQQSHGKSIIAAQACNCPDASFENKIISALNSTGFYGVIMVEVIVQNGICWVIEANPRLWGPLQLALNVGIDPLFLNSGTVGNPRIKHGDYLWLGGLLEVLAKGERPRIYLAGKFSILLFIIKNLWFDIYFQPDTFRLFINEVKVSLKKFFNKNIVLKFKGDAHVS